MFWDTNETIWGLGYHSFLLLVLRMKFRLHILHGLSWSGLYPLLYTSVTRTSPLLPSCHLYSFSSNSQGFILVPGPLFLLFSFSERTISGFVHGLFPLLMQALLDTTPSERLLWSPSWRSCPLFGHFLHYFPLLFSSSHITAIWNLPHSCLFAYLFTFCLPNLSPHGMILRTLLISFIACPQ